MIVFPLLKSGVTFALKVTEAVSQLLVINNWSLEISLPNSEFKNNFKDIFLMCNVTT